MMHAVPMSLLSLDKVTYLMHVSLETILPDPLLLAYLGLAYMCISRAYICVCLAMLRC